MILGLSLLVASDAADSAATSRSLSFAAREELRLVDKMRNLRTSIEELPEAFKAPGFKNQAFIGKQDLLKIVENMELESADRWNIILRNTAQLDQNGDSADRLALTQLAKVHTELEQKIDEVNLKLRDSLVMNLASQMVLK